MKTALEDIQVRVWKSYIKIPVIFLAPAMILASLYVMVYLVANSSFARVSLEEQVSAALPSELVVSELVVDPSLSTFHAYGSSLGEDGEEIPTFIVDEIHASIDLTALLIKRIRLTEVSVLRPDVSMHMLENGSMDVTRIFGADEPNPEGYVEPDVPAPFVLFAERVNILDGRFKFKIDGIFDIEIPTVNIERGRLELAPGSGSHFVLDMHVEEARAPLGKLRFYNELFGFPEEDGDWLFDVDSFVVKDWDWSDFYFSTTEFSAGIEGYTVKGSGMMGFPPHETIDYKGEGVITAPFWSPFVQYFVDDYLHFSVPEFKVSGEGTLDRVDSSGVIHADLVDALGLTISDIHSEVRLDDAILSLRDAKMNLYGGTATVEYAYFDLFQLVYGGVAEFEGVDPAPLIWDFFEMDASYLAGELDAKFVFDGRYPADLPYDPEHPTLYQHATDRWIDLVMLEPMVLRRSNRQLFPNAKITVAPGGRAWVDLDRAAITEATVTADGDVFEISDMVVNYNTLEFEPFFGPWGGRMRARLAALDPYLKHYDVDDVTSGVTRADIVARGHLMAPDFDLDLSISSLSAQGVDIPTTAAKLRVRDGHVDIDSATLGLDAGEVQVAGWISALQRSAEPDPDLDMIIYESRPRAPLSIDVSSRELELSKLAGLLPAGLDLGGRARADVSVRGRLDRMLACSRVRGRGVEVGGERFSELALDATLRDPGVERACPARFSGASFEATESGSVRTVEIGRAVATHERAGTFEVSGRYGFDESIDFEIDAGGLRLGALSALEGVGLTGDTQLSLQAQGSLGEPRVHGSVRSKGLAVGALEIGDLALVVDTIEVEVPTFDGETEGTAIERTMHVQGALLPFVSIAAEIPIELDVPDEQRAPIYARFGLDDTDLVEVLRATNLAAYLYDTDEERAAFREQLSLLSRAETTGHIELFMPPDMERYSVTASLSELEVGPKKLGFRNRAPISMSYVSEADGEDRIGIDSFTLGDGERFFEVSGGVTPTDGFLDLEVAGELDLSLIPLIQSTFPGLISEQIADASGAILLDAKFSGTTSELSAAGELEFSPSRFDLRGFADPVTIRSGKITLARDRVSIDEASQLRGGVFGGAFSVYGDVELDEFLPGKTSLKLWTHNISYALPDVASVTFNTDLVLDAEELLALDTWSVSGQVDLLEGAFYQDISVFEQALTGRVLGAFNRQTEVYESSVFDDLPELSEITFDVLVRARDGFKLQNQIERFLLDLEFRIELRLTDTLFNPSVAGNVEVIDGSVFFQGEDFEVNTGLVRFDGDPTNPYIDIIAVADIRNACRDSALQNQFSGNITLSGAVATGQESDDEIYQISLLVQGLSDNLAIAYDSSPYADQRDIISLILTGCTVDLLTASSASQPTLETLLGPLIGRLEREIQEVVSVEEFNIVPGVERTQIKISDNLTRRLSWQFQLDKAFNDLSGTGQSGQLQYQLTDRWSAVLTETTYSDVNTSNRFQIDLRLKYRLPMD